MVRGVGGDWIGIGATDPCWWGVGMKFLNGVMILFNEPCMAILAAWEEACHMAIAMTYEPTVCGGVETVQSTEALNFLCKDIPYELRVNVQHTAQEILGSAYYISLEQTYFHVKKNPPRVPILDKTLA